LSLGNATIFLHIDLKVNISLFKEYQDLDNVRIIKNRVKVGWGAYSLVQSMVNSFKEIIPHFKPDQYVSLISGQDYPLMTNEEMNRFLSMHQGKAFMEFYSIYDEWTEAIPRLERYHFTNYSFPGSTILETAVNSLLPKRVPPKALTYVGKSQWFTLTIEHINYIVYFLEKNPDIKRFFAYTWGSDEVAFQSILYSSKFKEQMINNNLRYIDWSLGGASPKVLTMNEVEALSSSGKFFGRKFDTEIDSQILDWIDTNLLS
jgi:hypothetical protein